MPTYTYNCPKCGQIELQRKMTDAEFKVCPTCNSELERIWTTAHAIWNTTGNYGRGDNLGK